MSVARFPDPRFFNALLVSFSHKDPLNVDLWGVDLIWIKRFRFDELLDFSARDAARRGGEWVEIASRLAIHQVAVSIAFPGFDDGQVRCEPSLENIGVAAELPHFLALRDQGANTGPCIKGRYA